MCSLTWGGWALATSLRKSRNAAWVLPLVAGVGDHAGGHLIDRRRRLHPVRARRREPVLPTRPITLRTPLADPDQQPRPAGRKFGRDTPDEDEGRAEAIRKVRRMALTQTRLQPRLPQHQYIDGTILR